MAMISLPKTLDDQARLPLPDGRAWVLNGADISAPEGTYYVRHFTGPISMLKVGAVLGHASAMELPNLRPATFWAPEDGIVIASRFNLDGCQLVERTERSGWAEAVDLWRPLVFAIQSAHQRGIVHGALNPWSVWFDRDAQRLVAFDGATWIARLDDDMWHGRTMQHDVRALARLLIYLHQPSTLHVEDPNLEGIPAYALPVLRRALEGEVTTGDLISGLAPAPTRTTVFATDEEDRETVLYGRVYGVDHVQHPSFGEGVKFWMTHPAYDEKGEAQGYSPPRGTFFYESTHGDVFRSAADVWDGAELNLVDARVVADSAGNSFLTAHAETLPVLEPHWPVPVTNVIKAQGCVSRYFVDLRDPGAPGRPLVLGNLVHGFLDDLTLVPDNPSFEASWNARIPNLRVSMLLAGLRDKDMPKFREDAQTHFDGIVSFAMKRSHAERVGWSGENVEVSRYSSVYGLEGRIDLVTQDDRTGLHIVELKTGRPRDEHISQVRCYRLLWDGLTNRREMTANGYLLYSKDARLQSTPLDDPLRERRLLRARNALVAAHHTMAFTDEMPLPAYMDNPRACRAPDCRFRKDRCAQQSTHLGLLADIKSSPRRRELWAYWRHFVRLLEVENWVDHEQIGLMLQNSRTIDRVKSHRAVTGLSLTDFTADALSFSGMNSRAFNERETVIAHRGDFHSDHIIKGRIRQVDGDIVTLETSAAESGAVLPKDGWILDKMPMRVGYRAAQQALYRTLADGDDDLIEILVRPWTQETELLMTGDRSTAISEATSEVLNDAQLDAVATAVSSPRGCLVQGPPGTGKTTVIAHTVRELVARGERVLLAAQTHTAVDTMLSRLLQLDDDIEFLRVGSVGRSVELVRRLEELGIDAASRFTDEIGWSTDSLDTLAETLQSATVVGCTTHAAARSDAIAFMCKDGLFDTVIIDESTQISEPMSLAAINRARRFVLVGDHKQLPPIVQSELANSLIVDGWTFDDVENAPQLGLFDAPDDDPESPGLRGLDQSLFERLANHGCPYVMLQEQYRMHADVMAFSNRSYYGGRLRSSPTVAGQQMPLQKPPDHAFAPVLDPAHPVVFVDVPGKSMDGRTNKQEAEFVRDVVRELQRVSPDLSIGVISPFRAQVHAIAPMVDRGIDVDTVERYQGSERDVIIVSLVKTSEAGVFLSDPRRLNVTLTRARTKLIIVGHQACLEGDPLFRELIHQPETSIVQWPES